MTACCANRARIDHEGPLRVDGCARASNARAMAHFLIISPIVRLVS